MGSQIWPVSFFVNGQQLSGSSSFPVTASDPDAAAYIDLLQKYDEAELESGVQDAINTFVVTLKNNNLWANVVHMQLLVGARTLEGIAVPLKGATPTLYGFSMSDYNRREGLLGNGVDSYINSNVSMSSIFNAEGRYYIARLKRGSILNSVYIGASGIATNTGSVLLSIGGTQTTIRQRVVMPETTSNDNSLRHDLDGVYGAAKPNGANHISLYPNINGSGVFTVATNPSNRNIYVFANNRNGAATNHSNGRIGLYSFGDYSSTTATDFLNFRTAIDTLFSSLASATLTS
jgi:hypothetical protein